MSECVCVYASDSAHSLSILPSCFLMPLPPCARVFPHRTPPPHLDEGADDAKAREAQVLKGARAVCGPQQRVQIQRNVCCSANGCNGGGRAPRTSKRIEPSAPTSACQSKKKKKKRGDGRRRIKGTKDKKKKKKDFKGIAGGGQKEGIVNALVAGQTIEEQVACVGA